MAYTTIVSGTNITSSWANASVRDQVVSPFASTAARTAAITSPVSGMVSTLTTAAATEGIYQYNTAAKWAAPWNLPWGYIGQASSTTTQTFSSVTYAALTNGTVNWTSVQNRIYEITYQAIFDCVTTAPVVGQVRLWTGVAQIAQANVSLTNVGDTATINLVGYQIATASTAYSVTAQAAVSVAGKTFRSVVGSGYPGTITVVDIGPAGAPA